MRPLTFGSRFDQRGRSPDDFSTGLVRPVWAVAAALVFCIEKSCSPHNVMDSRSATRPSIWVTLVIPVILAIVAGVLMPYGFGVRLAAALAALIVWEVALRVFARRSRSGSGSP